MIWIFWGLFNKTTPTFLSVRKEFVNGNMLERRQCVKIQPAPNLFDDLNNIYCHNHLHLTFFLLEVVTLFVHSPLGLTFTRFRNCFGEMVVQDENYFLQGSYFEKLKFLRTVTITNWYFTHQILFFSEPFRCNKKYYEMLNKMIRMGHLM